MASTDTFTVGDYILARLVQLGVRSVFGVPGDFVLPFLDRIDDHAGLNWIGCSTELSAAHAADGYARVSKGLGVLVTTFGAGALGAVNGVVGAFRERVPLLHIIGVPSTSQQTYQNTVHHILGGDCFELCLTMTAQLKIAREHLNHATEAGSQIDRVLISALLACRPAYLTLPTDLVAAKVSSAPLTRPLTLGSIHNARRREPSNAAVQTTALEEVVKLFKTAKNPAILIGACAVRFDIVDLVHQLVVNTHMPFFVTSTSKGVINEKEPLFGGVFMGDKSADAVKANFDKVDFLLAVGLLDGDLNGADIVYRLPAHATVELHSDHTKVAGTVYLGVTFFTMLPRLTELFGATAQISPRPQLTKTGLFASVPPPSSKPESPRQTPISHAWFWPTFAKYFRDGDIILSETGAAGLRVVDVEWPQGTMTASQFLPGSTGWAMAAAVGATTAATEANPKRRCVAFIGDSDAQVGVQELSTMLWNQLAPVIVLLNRDRSTAKRNTNGPMGTYRDVAPWRWTAILHAFGAAPGMTNVHKVSTHGELLAVLEAGFAPDKLTLVEVVLDKMGGARLLKVNTDQ